MRPISKLVATAFGTVKICGDSVTEYQSTWFTFRAAKPIPSCMSPPSTLLWSVRSNAFQNPSVTYKIYKPKLTRLLLLSSVARAYFSRDKNHGFFLHFHFPIQKALTSESKFHFNITGYPHYVSLTDALPLKYCSYLRQDAGISRRVLRALGQHSFKLGRDSVERYTERILDHSGRNRWDAIELFLRAWQTCLPTRRQSSPFQHRESNKLMRIISLYSSYQEPNDQGRTIRLRLPYEEGCAQSQHPRTGICNGTVTTPKALNQRPIESE